MSANVIEIYRAVLKAQQQTADACFANEESLASLTRCHNFLADLGKLRDTVAERPEAVTFNVAVEEYQYGISALISGHYRHAFASLRLAFELLLASIYFSAHEVKLRQWLIGSRDITWSALTDDNKGVFSEPFVKAFYPPLIDARKQFSALALTVYRECSEFVHGNPNTHHALSGSLEFRPEILANFHDKLHSIKLCVLYCFLYRYAPVFRDETKSAMEPLMMEAFGHESAVQAYFQEVLQ